MSVSEAFRGVVDESVESMESAPGINGFHLEPRCRICRNDQVRTKVNELLVTCMARQSSARRASTRRSRRAHHHQQRPQEGTTTMTSTTTRHRPAPTPPRSPLYLHAATRPTAASTPSWPTPTTANAAPP